VKNLSENKGIKEKWVLTQCHRCQSECGIKVKVINGVAVKIEGFEESSIGSRGGVCPRGMAGLQVLYDPNRLKYPMKRTNPEKGLGVDPKWERISWEEALTVICEKLTEAREEDPNSIIVQHGIVAGNQIIPYYFVPMLAMLANEKGAPTHINAAGSHCGNAGHFVNSLMYGAFVIVPDLDYCKYLLIFGTNSGFGGFQQWLNKKIADAKARGLKVVVFDPMCNAAGANADEWIPIIPGTDGIVALSILNVIANELNMVDEHYLRYRSNASYLIDVDTGKYVRDNNNGKPLQWDEEDGLAKVYDDKTIKRPAIDGEYSVNNTKCVPAWVLLKKRFAEYSPERAGQESQIPAATIRRIAKEFAMAASINSNIIIDGHELPYRPVSTYNIRSAGTHKNGLPALWAIDMLAQIVGASGAPGGNVTVSVECHGHEKTHRPFLANKAGKDGFTQTCGQWLFPEGGFWPVRDPVYPKHGIEQMFPTCMEMLWVNASDWKEVLTQCNLRTDFKVLINYATNAAMNGPSPKIREAFYKTVHFIVDCDLYSNEFNEAFADILLPDACYLEREDWMGIQHQYHNVPIGIHEPWCLHTSHKVIEPMYERRDMAEVVIEIANRMNLTPVLNGYYNHILGLKENLALKPNEKIIWQDLCNRACIANFGPEHDWNWFTENGFISWPKKVEEAYWFQFKDMKMQLYWEFMINVREKSEAIASELGIAHFYDWNVFDSKPSWFPLKVHKINRQEYPFYSFSFTEPFHSNSNNQEIPWIDEISRNNPYSYFVNMNEDTANAWGLKSGDHVEIETSEGFKAKGILKTRQSIHPDCIGIMGVSGHWAKGLPIARDKGVNFNSLIDFKIRDMDPLTATVDILVKSKVTKISS
jgi:molybdopterin-containing oxidoreductase family molybdopterin binding subunit